MAASGSESSDTENELGNRRPVLKAPPNVRQDFSLSESDSETETSTDDSSRNGTESAIDEADNGSDRNGHCDKPLASSKLHGFATTTARRPKPRYSSSESDSGGATEVEDEYQKPGEKMHGSNPPFGYSSDLGKESKETDKDLKIMARSGRVMFPSHKVADLRTKVTGPVSDNTQPSPEASEAEGPEDVYPEEPQHADYEDSEDADYEEPEDVDSDELEVAEPDDFNETASKNVDVGFPPMKVQSAEHTGGFPQHPNEPDLNNREFANTKKRRRKPSEYGTENVSQTPFEKRRRLSRSVENQLDTPEHNNTPDRGSAELSLAPLEQHRGQSRSARGDDLGLDNSPAQSGRRPPDFHVMSTDEGVDSEEERGHDYVSYSSSTRDSQQRSWTRSESESESQEEACANPKTGRFSASEIRTMERFKEGWCVQFQIDEHTFNQCINHRRKERFPTNVGFRKKDLLDEFLLVLPQRDKRSLFRYKERRWQNFTETPHKWTNDQDRELERLVKRHGTKWTTIASQLGRSQDDVAQRWRNNVANKYTKVTGSWPDGEIRKLRSAVRTALQYTSDNASIDEISWDTVSKIMGSSRTAQQCSGKWQKIQDNDERNRWYQENPVNVPKGYRVQLVRVQKGDKRQKPQKPGRPSTNLERGVEEIQSDTDIERPPEDSDAEEATGNVRPSKYLFNSRTSGKDPKPPEINAHSRAKTFKPPKRASPNTIEPPFGDSTGSTDMRVSVRQHTKHPSIRASREQDRKSMGTSPSSMSSFHKGDRRNKIHSNSTTSRTSIINQDLRLGDAFSATSPAALPRASQAALLQEERPSPQIAIRRAPARIPGRSELSQIIANTVDDDNMVEADKGDARHRDSDTDDGDDESREEDNGLADEDTQEAGRSKNSADRHWLEEADDNSIDSQSIDSAGNKQSTMSKSITHDGDETPSSDSGLTVDEEQVRFDTTEIIPNGKRNTKERLSVESRTFPPTPLTKSGARPISPQTNDPPSYADIIHSRESKQALQSSPAAIHRSSSYTSDPSQNARLEQEHFFRRIDDASAQLSNDRGSKTTEKSYR